jgi:hypothetical protein
MIDVRGERGTAMLLTPLQVVVGALACGFGAFGALVTVRQLE